MARKAMLEWRVPGDRPVVVTTEHRGVFVGYVAEDWGDVGGGEEILLRRARMVVYYGAATRGVLGIGARGVSPDSRVSPPVPWVRVRGVTAVAAASEGAAAAWEAEPWG